MTTTKKQFDSMVSFLMGTTGYITWFGEFDIHIDTPTGDRFMITHQLHGEDWASCCQSLQDWRKKQILHFGPELGSEPDIWVEYDENDN